MTDPLRSAALRHLTSMLASRRVRAAVGADPWDGDEDDETSATVETLVAIGALSAEEGRAWRARLERASAAPPAPDPSMHARAVEHLETVAADDHRLDGAIAAFAGAGLISRDEEKEWSARLRGAEPPVREGAMRVAIGDLGPAFDDSVLLRTLAGPEERVAGVRVTAVELYEGGVVIHWHYASDGSAAAEALGARLAHDEPEEDDDFGEGMDDEEWLGPWDPLQLRDDVGTRYSPGSAEWSSADERSAVTGHDGFAPGVPEGASRLEVIVEGRPLRIGLRVRGGA
jgi:hypothetical protein